VASTTDTWLFRALDFVKRCMMNSLSLMKRLFQRKNLPLRSQQAIILKTSGTTMAATTVTAPLIECAQLGNKPKSKWLKRGSWSSGQRLALRLLALFTSTSAKLSQRREPSLISRMMVNVYQATTKSS